jgi:3-oxoacyl-[acyl-carrier-protein] synthase-3
MASSIVSGVRIAGVASAVPRAFRTIADDAAVFGEAEMVKISQATGVRRRHVAADEICTSDLCVIATERLMRDLKWPQESINVLIFVTQTPDYILPATSCVIHERLGLSRECAAFDLNLGCSGYVYGLWVASRLIAGGGRALLLVGDTISRIASPEDRSVATLFGDAGSATALEADQNTPTKMHFQLGTDGGGHRHLMVPAGGFRVRHSEQTSKRTLREGGNIRCDEDLFMNGAEVFSFSMKTVPGLIASVLDQAKWPLETVDAFVLHQANRFMLEHLARRAKLPRSRLVLALEDYGNTSSASIPLAMTTSLAGRLTNCELRLLLAGFGVGFSWASVALNCGPLLMPNLIEVASNPAQDAAVVARA